MGEIYAVCFVPPFAGLAALYPAFYIVVEEENRSSVGCSARYP